MRITIGSDHAGYNLKSEIARWLAERGYAVRDLGTDDADTRVDYPDFARAVAQAVTGGEKDLGIAVCGTGLGVSITANKVPGVRAALCTDTYTARMSRLHNDANVLCLGQQVVGMGLALGIVAAWLQASFEGGRHARRLARIRNTKGTKVRNTKGTKVGNTKGTKVRNTKGTKVGNTKGTKVGNTKGTKVGNTKGTKVGNTKGTKVGNTKGTKVGRYQVTGH